MESIMDFINANYIWLIVIAGIILFALIGYIADKNGFNNKKQKSTESNDKFIKNEQKEPEKIQVNKKEKKKNVEEIVTEETVTEEVSSEEDLEQIDVTLMDEINLNEDELDLEIEPIENLEIKEELINNSKLQEEPIKVSSLKEESQKKSKVKTTTKPSDLNIDKDFNKVLDDVEEKANELNIEIPDEEEDIWKF